MPPPPPTPEDAPPPDGPHPPDVTEGLLSTPLAAVDPEPGSLIDGNRIIRKLGQGGMGSVYLAQQEPPLRRRVALKLIRSDRDAHGVIERFEDERQALAALQHAHIATIFDAGETPGGRPYFVMEYVDGQPITRFADERRLSIDARLELFGQVCEAVTHAHKNNILHLDLTSANVLALDTGRRPTVKVIDFGIAAVLGPAPSGSRAATEIDGPVVGTRHAMSPEQSAGRADLDGRADVYGLGVLLFGLLAGVGPHDPNAAEAEATTGEGPPPRCSQRLGAQSQDTAAKVAADRRLTPKTLIRQLHRELDFIPLKAMQPERDQRYGSVEELREDVDHFRRRRPLSAAPPHPTYVARKFISRQRRGLTAVAVVLVVALIGLGGTAWSAAQAQKQAAAAAAARREAERQTQLKQGAAYRSNFFAARQALDRGDAAAVRRNLAACPEALRHWEWGWLQAQVKGPSRVLPHNGDVNDLAFSPDGSKLLTASAAGLARVWDAATGEERVILHGHRRAVYTAAWAPDGRRVVTGSRDRTVRVWDIDSGAALAVLRSLKQTVRAVGFADAGAKVVAVGDNKLAVWNLATGQLERLIDTARSNFRAIAPDGGSVLFGRAGGELVRIGVDRGGRGWLTGGRDVADAHPVVVDGTDALLLRWIDGKAELGNAATGATLRPLVGAAAPVTCTAWHAGSGTAATGHADGSVWRHAGTGAGEQVMVETGMPVSALAWGDAGLLAAGDGRGVIRVLDLGSDEAGGTDATDATDGAVPEPLLLTGHAGVITALTFDPAGQRLASTAADRTARLWDARAADRDPDRARVSYVAASSPPGSEASGGGPGRGLPTARFAGPTHNLIARADDRGGIMLTGGPAPLRLVGHDKPVTGLHFSPDGRRLLSHSPDRSVRVWSTASLGPNENHPRRAAVIFHGLSRRGVRLAAWSPDGRWIATGNGTGAARVWEAATGRLLATCPGTGPAVTALAFDRDARWLAVGHQDGTAAIWDPRPGDRRVVLARHGAAVNGIAFSADAARVATTGADRTLRVWDAADGEALLTLPLDDASATPVFLKSARSTNPSAMMDREASAASARVVLAGGPRPTEPRGPQPVPGAAPGTARWVPVKRAGHRGVDPALTMRVTTGRRFDLLTPAGADPSFNEPAAAALLDRLSRSADRVDLLLGLEADADAGPHPRLVALPARAASDHLVDLGRFGGLQSCRLLVGGALLTHPTTPSTGDPFTGLHQGLVRNAFDLAPQHGEFRGGAVRLISILSADSGAEGHPIDRTVVDLRAHLTTLEARYARGTLTFLDAFTRRGVIAANAHRFPDAPPSSRRMFYAAAMLHLHANFDTREGGDAWLGRVYRLLATAPPTPGETPDGVLRQATLWCAAASAAAGRDLTPEFVDRWRLPLSADLRARFADTDWPSAADDFPATWNRLDPSGSGITTIR